MLLLHYLGKQVIITFSPINQSYTSQLHNSIHFIGTTSPNSNSVTATTTSVQNVIFIYTGLKSLPPFVSSIFHNALRQAIPCVNQALSQIGHISNWRLTHRSLHYAPYPTVNRTKIRTIRRPDVWRNEFRSFMLKKLDVHGVLEHCLA